MTNIGLFLGGYFVGVLVASLILIALGIREERRAVNEELEELRSAGVSVLIADADGVRWADASDSQPIKFTCSDADNTTDGGRSA